MTSEDIVARLRAVFHTDRSVELMNREAADEIERLREMLRLEREESAACAIDRKETQRERDEARQEILESLHPDLRKSYAAARGWDCFKVKDVDEWKMERMRDAIDSLPSFPLSEESKQ